MEESSSELAAESVAANAGAVPEPERIVAIDVLRGFALLGILVMNMQSFAMISSAYMLPYAYGDMTGANYWVWYLGHIFADQKFMTIFSMLFGAGIVLMTSRQEAKIGRSAKVHYKRMAILLFIGLIHAYVIWYGDILVCYALCGMLVFLFRRFRPTTLIVIGVIFLAIHSGLYWGLHQIVQREPPENLEEFRRGMVPTPEMVQEELDNYRGSWLGQFRHRAMFAVAFQTVLFGLWSFWRATGLMLIGMALYKLGVFSALRSAKTYVTMVIVGLLIGIPIIIYGNLQITAHQWEPIYTFFVGTEYNYWGSLFVSFAYIGLVMLVCQRPNLNWLTRPLAAVGQMALTNYLLHSIVCTTLFYGHGFGLFGYVERVGQIGIVVAIWTFQLIASPLWLRYFRFGPAEWLWRALTYGTLPPLRRQSRQFELGSGM